jgi:SAM-dependent MidA family methyltransferase
MSAGAALFIDYGFPAAEYYHPQREEGTLMCHYRHRAQGDPFAWPGSPTSRPMSISPHGGSG